MYSINQEIIHEKIIAIHYPHNVEIETKSSDKERCNCENGIDFRVYVKTSENILQNQKLLLFGHQCNSTKKQLIKSVNKIMKTVKQLIEN